MKTVVKLLIGICLLTLASCSDEPQSTSETSNEEIKVDLLFEHDGVKVYRFYDGSKRVYYTDARGKVSWSETRSSGKGAYVEDNEVETAK